MLGGLVPGDWGTGVTVVLGLEDGFLAQDWRRRGKKGEGRKRRAGWGEL